MYCDQANPRTSENSSASSIELSLLPIVLQPGVGVGAYFEWQFAFTSVAAIPLLVPPAAKKKTERKTGGRQAQASRWAGWQAGPLSQIARKLL